MSSGVFPPGPSFSRSPAPGSSPPSPVHRDPGLGPSPSPAKTFLQVLSEGQNPRTRGAAARGGAARQATPPSATAGARPGDRAQPADLKALAARALDAEKRVESLLASAGRGRTFSASELIALQATVFRYSQTVEVLSRATDRLVGALKQTLGTQV